MSMYACLLLCHLPTQTYPDECNPKKTVTVDIVPKQEEWHNYIEASINEYQLYRDINKRYRAKFDIIANAACPFFVTFDESYEWIKTSAQFLKHDGQIWVFMPGGWFSFAKSALEQRHVIGKMYKAFAKQGFHPINTINRSGYLGERTINEWETSVYGWERTKG
eukprot:153690_1